MTSRDAGLELKWYSQPVRCCSFVPEGDASPRRVNVRWQDSKEEHDRGNARSVA